MTCFAQITMQSTQLCKNLSICFSSGIGELNAQNKTVVYHNKYLWKNSAVQTCSLNSAQSRNIHRSAHGVHTMHTLCKQRRSGGGSSLSRSSNPALADPHLLTIGFIITIFLNRILFHTGMILSSCVLNTCKQNTTNE